MNRRHLMAAMCAALTAGCATQAEPSVGQNSDGLAARSFSFAVYGDSRSMMYLPYKADQEPQARPYDPATNEFVQMVMPFDTASEVTTLKVDKGWVTEATVEDKKLLPGVQRTMFRLEGGEWVAREVVKDVQRGRAKFIVNTGDLVWWGKQGTKPSDNPYWKLVSEDVLRQLPAPDRELQNAGRSMSLTSCIS